MAPKAHFINSVACEPLRGSAEHNMTNVLHSFTFERPFGPYLHLLGTLEKLGYQS